jgi:sterol desaturase/sphingolipid hydroxylase (fatty acid hydroxylase superfamily)
MDAAHIPDVLTPVIPVFVLTVIAEAFWVKKLKDGGRPLVGHTWKDTLASLTMGLGYSALSLGWKFVAFAGYLALYEWTPLRMGSGVGAWVLLFFAEDLCYYGYHRVHHESRFFWASHVVHHSSEHYNLSTALRQPWLVPTSWPFWAPLALLGFHPAMIFVQQGLNLLYQYWIHTEAIVKLPRPFEWLFNTPSHHRVHHGANPRYLDKNYAGILMLWDRLFGTFEPETEKPVYGLTKNLQTYNPLRIATHEVAAILRDAKKPGPLSQRLGYIFRNPAWKPATSVPPEPPPSPEAARPSA